MKQMVTVLLVTGLTSAAFGTTKAYDVAPYKCCIAETPWHTPVSQYYRNTLDSLSRVSVWIGDTLDTASFFVNVYDSVTSGLIAHNPVAVHAAQCWAWLNFPLARDADPVRGRTYKVVVTRPSGAAVSFAYCDTNPIAV